jgi:hypothetical protein
VGVGPAEAPRGSKGTQGGSVERRVDGEEGSGRPAWRVARGGGRRQRMWEKIGEGEPLMGGPPGTVQARSQTSLIQTHISNGFELYSN